MWNYSHSFYFFYIIFSNSSSLNIVTPKDLALSYFEPAASPAITKSVFLLTLPETFAPKDSNFSFIDVLD